MWKFFRRGGVVLGSGPCTADPVVQGRRRRPDKGFSLCLTRFRWTPGNSVEMCRTNLIFDCDTLWQFSHGIFSPCIWYDEPMRNTSSTAQGGCRRFEDRKPIGEGVWLRCMTGTSTERATGNWNLCLSMSLPICLSICHLSLIYLAVYLSTFQLSICLSNYLSATYLPNNLTIYTSNAYLYPSI